MRVTAEKRRTAFTYTLRVGDRINDDDGIWQVARAPMELPDGTVQVYLTPIPRYVSGRRRNTRPFVYDRETRVKIAR